MKIRHILLLLMAVLVIAFMQPLVTFLGGLGLLLGIGGLIFRDLPPNSQDALERRLLGWLRRVRTASAVTSSDRMEFHRRLPDDPAESAVPMEPPRRARTKPPTHHPATAGSITTRMTGDILPGDKPPPTV